MIFWRSDTKPEGPIYDWIKSHRNEIRSGTAEYMGTRVTETTLLYQFKYVISFGVATFVFKTSHLLPTPENRHLRGAHWKYTLLSALFGWWCFPWGPPFTLHAVMVNLAGGKARNASSLLQLLEWGWDAPSHVSAADHRKEILELSDAAVVEVRQRIITGGFENAGVRVAPVKRGGADVQITFDYPVSDGRDWVDESHGMVILIRKDDETSLSGCQIEFDDGTFRAIPAAKSRLVAGRSS